MDELKQTDGMVVIPVQEYKDLIERTIKAEMELENFKKLADADKSAYISKYWTVKEAFDSLMKRGETDGE